VASPTAPFGRSLQRRVNRSSPSPTTPDPAAHARSTATVVLDPRFRWWDVGIFVVLTVGHLGVLAFVLYAWWTEVDWGATRVVFPVLLLTIVIQVLLWEWRWLTLPLMRVPRERPAGRGCRVGIAVTFVPESEPIAMLEETVRALVAIAHPHETWVLDEGDDARVRELCERLGARHFTRKGDERFQQAEGPFRARTKYGNYNTWLDRHGYDRYDLIVAVDSDHILRPDYLDRVLGYFDDPEVAFVQPAQAYYNQGAGLVARGAAEETYAYYSSLLMAAQGIGYPLVVGCHNTHRVSALREIGGFAPHEADDMVMTLRYRALGWKGIYVPRILARGLVPADWAAYLKQQRRWARSVLDYKFRVFPKYGKRLPWLERLLNYVHGLYYLWGVVTAIQVALLVIVLLTGFLPPGNGVWLLSDAAVVLGVILPCEAYRQRFFLDRCEWGIHWRSGLLRLLKWPYFLVAAVDALGGEYGEYVVTSKRRGSRVPPLFLKIHVSVLLVVSGAWAFGTATRGIEFIAVHAGAAFTAAISILALLLARRASPPPYDPALRDSRREDASA